MSTRTRLITADDFLTWPDEPGCRQELIRGEVVTMTLPGGEHGEIALQIAHLILAHVKPLKLGKVYAAETGFIVERDPDTVRGADVAYYSYARLPKGPLPAGYGPEVPELVIEVRSTSDSWRDILVKVGEYLAAGVLKVIVLDPRSRKAHIYSADEEPEVLGPEDELTVPELLGEFQVAVHRFFD